MDYFLWIDLEMTGLHVENEVPIEIAAVVTNKKLEHIDSYHSVIHQPLHYLEKMDEWNKKHHTESGLLSLIPSGKSSSIVEVDLLQILDKYWPEEKAIIAGNSIFQDRLFINKYFQSFAERLHYRMLDVTAFKIVFNQMYQHVFQKQNNHRAIDDIKESIAELNFYLSFIRQ